MDVDATQREGESAVIPAEAASPSESPGVAGGGGGEGVGSVGALSPLAMLMAGHMIPDGEVVILLLKPSLWFIPLSSLMTLGVAGVIAVAAILFAGRFGLSATPTSAINAAVLLAGGRLMYATLQWMGRYYLLTDMRLMSLSGVFNTQVSECPLRRVARVRTLRTFRDRVLGVGNIEIIPLDENLPIGLWQTVAKPRDVKERLTQAIARAKSSGRGV